MADTQPVDVQMTGDDESSEWEYEYHDTETEVRNHTLFAATLTPTRASS